MNAGTLLISVLALAVGMTARAASLEDTYFAPENQMIFKMVGANGATRLFEYDAERPGLLRGTDGWTGRIESDGKVLILSDGILGRKAAFVFDRGRLVSARTRAGEKIEFPYELNRKAPSDVVSPLAMLEYDKDFKDDYLEREQKDKWSSGRLTFPYVNPNQAGALYAELALISLILLAWRGLWPKMCAAVLLAVFFGCLLATGSRGAMLGFLLGAAVFASRFYGRLLRSRFAWAVLAVSVAMGLVWFCLGGRDNVIRGFSGGHLDWSNWLRVDMWKAAPQMMADASSGWGFCGAGRAYLDWYMPTHVFCVTGSLMNDHLTWLVNFGWGGRFAYLTLLVAIVILCGLAYVRVRDPLPLGIWGAFLLMAWFNPVFRQWGLWVVPIFVLVWAGYALKRTGGTWRMPVAVTCISAMLSLVLLGGLFLAPSILSRPGLSVKAVGSRVLVNGSSPKVWVVDDGGGAIGGCLVGKDIRDYYSELPHAPAIGYVRSVHDLPKIRYDKLVLTGKGCVDWLMDVSENEEARQRLPASVIFVNPPFSPLDIPEGVLKTCHVEVLVGEFAARFDKAYANPPAWVRIVPGMERYILRWIQYVFEV